MKRNIAIIALFVGFFLYGVESQNAESKIAAESQINNEVIGEVKNIVESKFINFYKDSSLHIENLEIAPTLNSLNLAKMKLDRVIFDEKLLSKESGNFEVILQHNQKRQRVFFNFNINATIQALSATNSIKSGEVIDTNNTQMIRIPISKAPNPTIKADILNEYSAKSFISNGSIITQNKITPKIIVEKGDILEVTYNEENIHFTFSAKALESASIGQTIKAQNTQSNKSINITITSPKTATMQ